MCVCMQKEVALIPEGLLPLSPGSSILGEEHLEQELGSQEGV